MDSTGAGRILLQHDIWGWTPQEGTKAGTLSPLMPRRSGRKAGRPDKADAKAGVVSISAAPQDGSGAGPMSAWQLAIETVLKEASLIK